MAHIPIKLPQHIRIADQAVWRAWMDSRNVSTIDTKRTYTRQLIGFYEHAKKSISEAESVDIDNYEYALMRSNKSTATITHTIRTIKSYWKYARQEVSA